MNTRPALNHIARRQQGLITHDQALVAGVSASQIRRRVRSGEWSVIRPGVYVAGGAPPTWLQSVAAVALGTQPEAWISHQTAAAIWGLPVPDDDSIHVVTGLARRVRLEGVRGHRSGALFGADLTLRHGIPVTTAARALVDLSGQLSYRQLGSSIDDALRRRIMRLRSLGNAWAGSGRRPAAGLPPCTSF